MKQAYKQLSLKEILDIKYRLDDITLIACKAKDASGNYRDAIIDGVTFSRVNAPFHVQFTDNKCETVFITDEVLVPMGVQYGLALEDIKALLKFFPKYTYLECMRDTRAAYVSLRTSKPGNYDLETGEAIDPELLIVKCRGISMDLPEGVRDAVLKAFKKSKSNFIALDLRTLLADFEACVWL